MRRKKEIHSETSDTYHNDLTATYLLGEIKLKKKCKSKNKQNLKSRKKQLEKIKLVVTQNNNLVIKSNIFGVSQKMTPVMILKIH